MLMPNRKSKKRKQEAIHEMTTITSRRRKKSRSLKDRGSLAQVRHIYQARDAKLDTLNRTQPIFVNDSKEVLNRRQPIARRDSDFK